MRRLRRAIRAALPLLALLAAAGPVLAQPAGELRVAVPWTPENLDPTTNLASIRAKVGVSMFDSLVGRDADDRIVPQLAESWKALDDRTWQFRLRFGVVFHDGERITLEAPAGRYQGDQEIAEALGGQWQKAGFRPRVQVAEWEAYFKCYLGKQLQDAYLLDVGGPTQEADELYNLVSSKGRGLYYKNEKIDALFDAGRSTTDPGQRRKIYADLARAMVEDATGVFLLQQVDIYAASDRLTWTPRGDRWMPRHEAGLK